MIDDIIKIFQAIPHLTLSKESLKEFLWRTNSLAGNLNLATFNQHLLDYPETKFSFSESRHIQQYIKYWPILIHEFTSTLDVIHLAWYDMYKKPMGGDDILPAFIELMPNHKATLQDLIQKFSFAVNVDRDNQSTYYFTALAIAAEHASENIDINSVKSALYEKLHNPIYFNLVTLIVKLSSIFKSSMKLLADQIYVSLKAHNNHDYNFNEEHLSERDKFALTNDSIKKMMDNIRLEPFNGDIYLTAKIHKHLTYQDFMVTLNRPSIRSFKKLIELCHKFEVHNTVMAEDFNQIGIELTDEIRSFLDIPAVKRLSILNLFIPAVTKIPFPLFISHLSKKMEALNELREKIQLEKEFVIPNPEQLAIELRRSL